VTTHVFLTKTTVAPGAILEKQCDLSGFEVAASRKTLELTAITVIVKHKAWLLCGGEFPQVEDWTAPRGCGVQEI